MLRMSHTRTVRSSLPDTTLSPLANTADVTGLKKHENNSKCESVVFKTYSMRPKGHRTTFTSFDVKLHSEFMI